MTREYVRITSRRNMPWKEGREKHMTEGRKHISYLVLHDTEEHETRKKIRTREEERHDIHLRLHDKEMRTRKTD